MSRDNVRIIKLCLLVVLVLSACTTVGPRTVQRDQVDYANALSTAQQEQLLHNIVRLRYLESPVFLKVSSLVNQYELEGSVALRAGFDDNDLGRNSQNIGAQGRWADKPTITFSTKWKATPRHANAPSRQAAPSPSSWRP